MPLTVCCVLWQGAGRFKRRVYGPEHVERLRAQVVDHLPVRHRFVCLSNVAVPCERIEAFEPWPGWWQKCCLFGHRLFEGRVLYLDLDVTVVADLSDIAFFPAPFTIINDWNRRGFNSSVMSWDAGAGEDIYGKLTEADMSRLRGDQDWIGEIMGKTAACFPLDWCASYKRLALRGGKVPAATRIVVYHGLPKSWDLPPDHLDQLRRPHA